MSSSKKINFKIPSKIFDAVYSMPIWQKIVILLLSWIIPIALFWYLFMGDKLGELESISSKLPKLRQEIVILEAKKKQLPVMEKELKEMEAILKQAMKLLPEKEDIPSVLTAISSLGNEARLEFETFQPGQEQYHDFYASIPVLIKFRGPFHNTVVFFDRVSRMSRIVHIENITMGKAQESAQIWSQTTGAQGNSAKMGSGAPVNAPGAQAGPGDAGEGDVVQRGGTWVIETQCTAVTYRFLTPEEQAKLKKKKKKKR